MVVLLIAENLPHEDTRLSFNLPADGYTLAQGEGLIAYDITAQYLSAIFSSLSERWFEVTELAVAHSRVLVSEGGLSWSSSTLWTRSALAN